MKNNQKIAKIGENLACRFLAEKHYQILQRNVKFRSGEIDIVAQKDKSLIFVEVKTRTSLKFGYPEEALNYQKRQRLAAAINQYILEKDYQGNWQADLITIDLNTNKAQIRHYQSIELESN